MRNLVYIILFLSISCGPKPQKTMMQKAMMKSPKAAEEHIETFKTTGEATTLYFQNVPIQSSFDGIAVEGSPLLDGPYTDVPLTIAKTDVSVTFPAPDPPIFLRPYYYKLSSGVKTRVAASHNVVKISQIPTIPPGPLPPTPIEPIGPAPVITVR